MFVALLVGNCSTSLKNWLPKTLKMGWAHPLIAMVGWVVLDSGSVRLKAVRC